MSRKGTAQTSAGAPRPTTARRGLEVSTGEPAFACDHEGRVVDWNVAAERLLGHRAADVVGRPCHLVLCGVDLFGNRVCTESCALRHMARDGEPPHGCELEVRRADGRTVHVELSIVTVREASTGEWRMIHVMHPLTPVEEVAEVLGHILHGASTDARPAGGSGHARGAGLTPRELSVLRRMADGATTEAMSHALGIRVTTVRTHVQAILLKLGVHSRAGAVARAVRDHLL